MIKKIKYFINEYKKRRMLSNYETTYKGECFFKYLENKINNISQSRIDAYEEILEDKDINLYYQILKSVKK